jgi:hypothetical protein
MKDAKGRFTPIAVKAMEEPNREINILDPGWCGQSMVSTDYEWLHGVERGYSQSLSPSERVCYKRPVAGIGQ